MEAEDRPRVFVEVPASEEPIGAGVGVVREASGWAVAGEVIVRLRPEVARRVRAGGGWNGGLAIEWLVPRRRAGLAGGAPPVFEQLARVRLPRGMTLAEGLAQVRALPEVLYAEPNLRMELAVEAPGPEGPVPSDFQFSRQWALHNTGQTGGTPGADVGALEAWSVTTGSPSVVAAIIDTGLDFFHPDLEPNVWRNPGEIPGNGIDDDGNGYVDDVHGFDFVSEDGDPMDDNVHGTHVGGILGAVGNDANGMAGMAWSVRLLALKAFDEVGAGTLDDTLSAIGYAVAAGARILNASWGTTTRSRALDDAVTAAVDAGVVVVAAAGNGGNDAGFYPAAVPAAIAVGSTDARDELSVFSNYGAFVDLVAPGDLIESTAPNTTWTSLSGTSMAAPHVSGAAALLLAWRPDFTPREIATLLTSSAEEIPASRFAGAGRLDAGRALRIGRPLPEAELDLPAEVSGVMDLPGRAGGPGFQGYRVELGAGRRPQEWSWLGGSGVATTDGWVLRGWDTTIFDDGEYTLRLTVSNALGQAARVRMPVAIRNVRLLDPRGNDVLRRGDVVTLRGTAAGVGRRYHVAWGVGAAPAEWRTEGVTLPADGGEPVVQGTLGTWDTSVLGTNTFVTLRLTASRDGRVVGETVSPMIHLEDRLRPGWPRLYPYQDEFPPANWREFGVADLEGDGRQEIVLVDHGEPSGRPPRLVVLDSDGGERWSRDLPGGAPEYDAPVMGDLDGDGRLEIVVDTGGAGSVRVFDASGTPWGGGWPATPGGTHFGKVLADLDGDGRLEVIVLSNPPADLGGAGVRHLAVLDAEGRTLRRWQLAGCGETPSLPEQRPAVANLDDDADLEIVAVDGCVALSAFDVSEGSGPVWTATLGANLFASPVTGDLDGDGTDEVVVVAARRERGLPGGVHVIGRDGRARDGWPVLTEGSFELSPALADLDGDGWVDIIVAEPERQTVHALRIDGFELPGWPLPYQSNARLHSMPVVGDLDGDGRPDVALATGGFGLQLVLNGEAARAGGVFAWRGDGMPIDFHPGFPADGLVMAVGGGSLGQRLPGMALADLDGNGRLDLVAATRFDVANAKVAPLSVAKMRASLHAWELDVPVTSGSLVWPMSQGGPQRTGRFERPPVVNQPPRVAGIPHQTIAVGGAFRPVLLDRYVEDPDDPVDALSWTVAGGGELRAGIDDLRVLRVVPPRADWEGRTELQVEVRDPKGAVDTAIVVVAAVEGFQAPQAVVDLVRTLEDTEGIFEPLLNDVAPSGRSLRIGGLSRAVSGDVELLESGQVRYLPAPDFAGDDLFEYTLLDDAGGMAVGEVRIVVSGVNDAPRPEVDRLLLEEDTSVEFDPLLNDVDPDGDPLELVFLGAPLNGRVEPVGGGRFRYLPDADYSGSESLEYHVRDPAGLTATGEVALLVKPVNDPPRIRDQTVRLNRNTAADVFYDAVDVDGDTLEFNILDGPEHGVLLSYPSIANYEPERGFSGTDRFTYEASDGQTRVGPATVTLVVDEANNPPEVESDSIVTAVDQPVEIPLRVEDADEDPISVSLSRLPEHGSVVLDGTRARYTPSAGFVGNDHFGVAASDGQASSGEARVEVRVTEENTPPVATSEILTVARNQASAVRLQAIDAENNPLRFQVVTNPVFGRLEGEAPALTYIPLPDFRGLDRLSFLAQDREFTSTIATVHLWVREPNTVPTTTDQTLRVAAGAAGVPVRLEASDADGHALRAVILKGPGQGRVFGTGVDYTYVPSAGFLGRDRFTYRVWDGFAYSATATVTLLVESPPPVRLEILAGRRVPAGFELIVRGSDGGGAITFQTSEDLRRWTTVAVEPMVGGEVRWIDRRAMESLHRFYRVVQEAP